MHSVKANLNLNKANFLNSITKHLFLVLNLSEPLNTTKISGKQIKN